MKHYNQIGQIENKTTYDMRYKTLHEIKNIEVKEYTKKKTLNTKIINMNLNINRYAFK